MLGNYAQATDAVLEQLALYHDLSLRPDAGGGTLLLCVAAIAARRGPRRVAALIAGAATSRFEERPRMAAEELLFNRIHDQLLKPMRETDPLTWDAAAQAGRQLSDPDVIDTGLGALKGRPQQATTIATDSRV
jgi:hypothetical protein